VKNKEDEIFGEEEIVRITEFLKKHNDIMINLGLLFDFQSGIRTGELAAVKFTDMYKNTIRIQRQEVKYKDPNTNKCVHVIKDYPKTDAGCRDVILPDSAMETIAKAKLLNPNGEFIFMTNGKRILTNSYNDALARVCKELGIKRKSMHKIRRTYGTTLIDGDCDDSTVADQMGHADITTTRGFYYYTNKSKETKEKQIKKAITI
jgi:integrase